MRRQAIRNIQLQVRDALELARSTSTFTEDFFAPLLDLLGDADRRRVCMELTDDRMSAYFPGRSPKKNPNPLTP